MRRRDTARYMAALALAGTATRMAGIAALVGWARPSAAGSAASTRFDRGGGCAGGRGAGGPRAEAPARAAAVRAARQQAASERA